MLQKLIELRDRSIYHVEGTQPAVYFVADKDAGGVLVNTPAFDPAILDAVQSVAPLKYIFLPSRLGAHDLDRWRERSGAEAMAFEAEVASIEGGIDLKLDKKSKLTRTIDFLPMAGVTQGSCAMRLRNKPGVMFFGPILLPGEDGWPTLRFSDSDYSYESRLFGALGVQDLQFEYAFTDAYEPGRTQFGPGAGEAVKERIEQALEL